MIGQYYTSDHLGSIRELVNSSGTLLTRYSYDPYGRVTATYTSANTSTPPIDATVQYTGDYYHATSELNLTKLRAYDPNTARWLSRDPLKNAEMKQGPNLYEYVSDNPIFNIDTSGTCTCEEAGAAKDAILAEAAFWQEFENPPYAYGFVPWAHNDCGDQASALEADLENVSQICWDFRVDYGQVSKLFPSVVGLFSKNFDGSHNVVEVDPVSTKCCKTLTAFTLDPYAGNNSMLNFGPTGPVKQGTPSDFNNQYPYPDFLSGSHHG